MNVPIPCQFLPFFLSSAAVTSLHFALLKKKNNYLYSLIYGFFLDLPVAVNDTHRLCGSFEKSFSIKEIINLFYVGNVYIYIQVHFMAFPLSFTDSRKFPVKLR